MNYQPFYDMNLLVSNPMLQALQEIKFYLIFFAIVTFYFIVFLHYLIFSFIARFILIRRRVSSSNGNVEALL